MDELLTRHSWEVFAEVGHHTLVGGVISQIEDRSGNGRHITQTTAAARPGVSGTLQNGRPLASFFAGKYLLIPSITLGNCDIFVGYYREIFAGSNYVYCRGPGPYGNYPEYFFLPGGANMQLYRGAYGGFNFTTQAPVGWHVNHQRWDGSHHGAWQDNAEEIGSNPVGLTGAAQNETGIGSDTNGAGTFQWSLGCYLVHAGLTLAEAAAVRATLTEAYGT